MFFPGQEIDHQVTSDAESELAKTPLGRIRFPAVNCFGNGDHDFLNDVMSVCFLKAFGLCQSKDQRLVNSHELVPNGRPAGWATARVGAVSSFVDG